LRDALLAQHIETAREGLHEFDSRYAACRDYYRR